MPDASNPLSSQTPATTTGDRPVTADRQHADREEHRDLAGDAEKFEHALQQDGDHKSASHDRGGEKQQGREEGGQSPGDALLQSLFGVLPAAREAVTQTFAPFSPFEMRPPEPPRSTESKLADLASQVADRVLVTDPTSGANSEVRIQVKDSILPNTEIRITRQAGELQVQIVTKSQEVSNQLNPQVGALQAMLQERLPRETVRVQVDFGGASGEESRRGSRNPRSVLEEEEQEES